MLIFELVGSYLSKTKKFKNQKRVKIVRKVPRYIIAIQHSFVDYNF